MGVALAGDRGCCLRGGRPEAEVVRGKAVGSSLADFHTSAARAIGQRPHTADHSGQDTGQHTKTGS